MGKGQSRGIFGAKTPPPAHQATRWKSAAAPQERRSSAHKGQLASSPRAQATPGSQELCATYFPASPCGLREGYGEMGKNVRNRNKDGLVMAGRGGTEVTR